MAKIADQVKSELKQLPFMIGKLVAGIVAIYGFTMAVLTITRKADASFSDILPSLSLGGAGIFIFALLSGQLAKKQAEKKAEPLVPEDNVRTSMLSWIILLLLAAVFLLCTYLMTR